MSSGYDMGPYVKIWGYHYKQNSASANNGRSRPSILPKAHSAIVLDVKKKKVKGSLRGCTLEGCTSAIKFSKAYELATWRAKPVRESIGHAPSWVTGELGCETCAVKENTVEERFWV